MLQYFTIDILPRLIIFQANTFQAIIITDGRKSYSIYTYKCGDLFWPESAIIGFNAPLMDFINDPHSGNSAHIIACIHFSSLWSNIVYDLQPGSVILPTTPEPSSFTGQFFCDTYILSQNNVTPFDNV